MESEWCVRLGACIGMQLLHPSDVSPPLPLQNIKQTHCAPPLTTILYSTTLTAASSLQDIFILGLTCLNLLLPLQDINLSSTLFSPILSTIHSLYLPLQNSRPTPSLHNSLALSSLQYSLLFPIHDSLSQTHTPPAP